MMLKLLRAGLLLGVGVLIPAIWGAAMILDAWFTGDCGVRPVCSRWEAVRFMLVFGAIALAATCALLVAWKKMDGLIARKETQATR